MSGERFRGQPAGTGCEQDVLAGRVSAGPRGKRAAAQSAQGAVHHGGAGLDGGEGVGHAEPPGVVAVIDDRRAGDSSRTRRISPETCAGTAWPRVSQRTMSLVPSARGSLAMDSTRSSGTVPSKGQVNDVAMHSWICPPTARAYSTACGSAARLRPWCGRCSPCCASPTPRGSTGSSVPRRPRPWPRGRGWPPRSSTFPVPPGSVPGPPRACWPWWARGPRGPWSPSSMDGTPRRSSSRTVSTFRSVESILPVSWSPSRRVTSRRRRCPALRQG